ncbi:MAG: phosphoribosylanthranilate isomerase [Desulfobacterales bacterium]|nr:phosphoribosylanthranilate isomerase [Desulfobacterales bacterium]
MPVQSVQRAYPQIKICGLTRPDEAEACAAAGADAIGLVFYPPSPRNLTAGAAAQITRVLTGDVCPVGVFVNETYETVMSIAEKAGLHAVQLHGQERPPLVERLKAGGLIVIKALFFNGRPDFTAADRYAAADAHLVECVGGPLPGGNALAWNWSAASSLSTGHPVVLAGGLNPENVSAAIADARPQAVDVSSGVEREPGRKDISRVAALCRAVARTRAAQLLRPVFTPPESRPPG